MSPALAFGWYIWTRHRRGLILLGGCWLAAMIFYRAMPAGAFTLAPDETFPPALLVSIFFCSCSIAAGGYLLIVFSFGSEAQLEAYESGFPARLWHLPLPTHALVGWPMLGGSATMVLGWGTLAWAARRPCGFDLPLLWPGLLLAVLLAWVQAILWTPFPLPWVRAVLSIPLSSILVLTPTAILTFGIPPIAACASLAVMLSAAYLTAARGVARGRRGDNVQWSWPAWMRWGRTTTPPRRSFASTARAQVWFEWRLHGLLFPVAVAACAVIFLPMIPLYATFFDDADRVELPVVPPRLLHEIGSLWLVVVSLLLLMPLMAAAFGLSMGRSSRRNRTYRLSSFVTARPISTAALIRAKFTMAALATLAAWSLLAVGLLLWFALGGHAAEMAEQFETMRQRHAPALFWGWLMLLLGGAVLLTWLNLVKGMWMGLARRAGEKIACLNIAVLLGLTVCGVWLGQHPEYWPVLGRLLPWLAGVAVVLKCLAATWSLTMLNRLTLIPPGVLWGTLGVWLVLAVGAFVALNVLLPDDWFSVPVVVLGIVLLLPLTRLALAPLALAWNRHR